MEFRYRADERRVDEIERGSSSMYPNFIDGNDFGRLISRPTYILRESLLEDIRRKEIIVKKIGEKIKLEHEILIEMERLNQYPVYEAEAIDVEFEHGFQRCYFDSWVIRDGNEEVRGCERLNLTPNVLSRIEASRKSLDIKFPASKLGGKKRNLNNGLPLPAKKRRTTRDLTLSIEKEWTCSLCGVNATSKTNLNQHIRGKKHRSKEAHAMMMSIASPTIEEATYSSDEKEGDESLYKEKCIMSFEQTTDEEKVVFDRKCNKKGVWWCDICRVKCYSEETLQYHLVGKKHKSRSGKN